MRYEPHLLVPDYFKNLNSKTTITKQRTIGIKIIHIKAETAPYAAAAKNPNNMYIPVKQLNKNAHMPAIISSRILSLIIKNPSKIIIKGTEEVRRIMSLTFSLLLKKDKETAVNVNNEQKANALPAMCLSINDFFNSTLKQVYRKIISHIFYFSPGSPNEENGSATRRMGCERPRRRPTTLRERAPHATK